MELASKQYFEAALTFLKQYQWVFNYPNTHILVHNIFDEFPQEWVEYFEVLTNDDLNLLSLGSLGKGAPSSLVSFFCNLNKLKGNFPKKDCVNSPQYQFPKNCTLSVKKRHEILSLAPVIYEIYQETDCDFIIDVGAGVGYLPQLLYQEYNYRVLGIEGNSDKVRLAHLNLNKHPESIDSVKFIEHFVTDESIGKFQQICEEFSIKSACITGLHACADLSVTILQLFTKLERAKSLVIMPCCYHRLKLNEDGGFVNFPASNLLKELSMDLEGGSFLTVPFLRLACQGSVSEFSSMSAEEHDQHARNCLFRAILQAVAETENVKVSRLRRKSGGAQSTFEGYLRGLGRTHALVDADIGDDKFLEKMREKWARYNGCLRLIQALMALQCSIQGVCESVVLLDRAELLKENGVACAVARVTDERISPRCHALIAKKY